MGLIAFLETSSVGLEVTGSEPTPDAQEINNNYLAEKYTSKYSSRSV
jgi:hypothetical protein